MSRDGFPAPYWQDMPTTDFQPDVTADWIAVLPVAAIEQHGPHLPVSTDTAIGTGMVEATLSRLPDTLPATFLPMQQVGKSNEHISSPGTLTHSWETVVRSWIELGESVHRAGVRKLVLINSHGGNVPIIDIVARELRVRFDMLCVGTGWMRFGLPDGSYDLQERIYGIHGCDVETSIMLHLRPDLVRMDKAEDFKSSQLDYLREFKHLRAHGPAQFGWKAQDLNVAGTVGNAAMATAEKGRAIVDHQAERFVELLDDMHRFDLKRLWTPS
jgi:creatinine amidohydrolase